MNELVGRSQQKLAMLADRCFISGAGEMSDEALYNEFKVTARNSSGEGTAEMLRDRLRHAGAVFLPPLGERKAIVEIMNRRFPSQRDAIIGIADRAIEGRFDLLGCAGLDFGNPVDWHLDPRTGDRCPLVHWSLIDPVAPIGSGDLKVMWEINRTAHFVSLGQSYWLTGDHRYAEAFVDQADSWIDSNPAGMGIGWAASLDVAFRAISWLWALHLCADSREITKDFVARIVKSLIEHGRHIEKYLSHYFSPNTHLTGEALGLFYLGLALPELRRADNWRKLGLRILLEQLPVHLRTDGVYFEQASYYHRYTTDFYTHLFALVRANGVALAREDEQMLWRRLEEAYDHLLWISRPDGTWPIYGDDDGGRLIKFAPRAANDFSDTLAMGAAVFKRGDMKRKAGDAPVEMLWLLGPEGIECYDDLDAMKPAELSKPFETSGYYVMRDGWDPESSFALIDCGMHGSELGCGHAHSDALSVDLALRGATWLVDPATFVYGADSKTRDWFRATEAHNTATVDGKGQSEPAGPFAWRTTANCKLIEFDDRGRFVVFTGSHDGYQRLSDPVTHERSLLMLRDKPVFILTDRFKAGAWHSYAIRYHFAPGCVVRAERNRVEARNAAGENLVINFFANGPVRYKLGIRIENGWVSTCYGHREEAPVAVLDAEGEGSIEFTAVILVASKEV